jgi:hypothetical protein
MSDDIALVDSNVLVYALFRESEQLSKAHIAKLAAHFSVSPGVFLC